MIQNCCQEELQKNLNTRNRLYYKRRKLDNECEKDAVSKDIIRVTFAIEKARKEIKLCDEVGDNVRKMKEQIKKQMIKKKGKGKRAKERNKRGEKKTERYEA